MKIDLAKSYKQYTTLCDGLVDLMATVCNPKDGFGIILVVYQGIYDKGKLLCYPHFHVYEKVNGPCIGRYIITKHKPKSIKSLVPYVPNHRCDTVIEQRIIDFALSQHPRFKMNGWLALKNCWDGQNEGDRSFL